MAQMLWFNENRSCIEIRNHKQYLNPPCGLMKTEVVLKYGFSESAYVQENV